MKNKNFFAEKIVKWYELNKRNLPWRETTDPFRIWLSEIILQQTRVAQGLPYYQKFIARFPNIISLARASEETVLRSWQGLGYYSRARNLHRCAKLIAEGHKGKFPNRFADLIQLPGIGQYTGAAIASIAFQEPVAVVDGNVYRVLARVFGIEEDISSGKGKEIFFEFAQRLVPQQGAAIYNQAIMEFGALHCLPRKPKCEECIFIRSCVAYANAWQDRLPLKTKKVKARRRYFTYFVFKQNNKWGMQKRTGQDIWKGLFDFYLVESGRHQRPENIFSRHPILKKLKGELTVSGTSPLYKHLLTHQNLHARFVSVQVKHTSRINAILKKEKLVFYSAREIAALPKPVLVSRFLEDHLIL